MTRAAIFLFFVVYALLLTLVAGVAAAGFYVGFLMITGTLPILLMATGAGLVGFGLLVLFYFVKFLFGPTKVDKVVYAVISAAALTLAIASCGIGVWTILKQPAIMNVVAGVSLIVADALVLFFFIKLLFSRAKPAGGMPVNDPSLLAFIRQITGMRVKVFLTPDVKVRVYPGRIELGLGLVNMLNISEFKAVLAQEFGYYRQRRVYLIYTALHDKSRYKYYHALKSFAQVSHSIGVVIQHILLKVYTLIMKTHLEQSHEAVFEADKHAADIAGGNNLATALGKIEIGAASYAKVLNAAATTFMKDKKISRNVYNNQLTVFHSMVEECQFASARVHYKDQWTSYPTLAERILRLKSVTVTDETSAWELFNNTNASQEALTAKLYRAIDTKGFQFYDAAEFDAWYLSNAMPAVYKGFYSNRYLDIRDWDLKALAAQPVNIQLDDLNGQLQSIISRNDRDIAALKVINTLAFDFDGKRYPVKDVDLIIAKIEEETIALKEKQSQLDKQAFALFYQQHHEVMALYQHYQSLQQQQQIFTEASAEIIRLLNTLVINEEIHATLHKIASLEVVVKEVMRSITPASPAINNYIHTQYTYFSDSRLHEEEIYALRSVLMGKVSLLEDMQHNYYRTLVREQLHL